MNRALQPGLHGAFMAQGFGLLAQRPEPVGVQSLAGVRLAVKDVYDVAGLTCGAGNPQWLQGQPQARVTAASVSTLLACGCHWVGKTVTDELTYSLAGINVHYGTPINPLAPERLPGGSSSGSAVAVAAGYADLALGTDCGGSVRLPASYCGIWGIRPSHDRVSAEGCFTLAGSFDTVGWFARDGQTLALALDCLLPASTEATGVSRPRLIVSEDVLGLLDDDVRDAFEAWLKTAAIDPERLPPGRLPLAEWAAAFRTLQAGEVWQRHGDWVSRVSPRFGADVEGRFENASRITSEQRWQAAQTRLQARSTLARLLGSDALFLLPPVPAGAPRLDASPAQVSEVRLRSQQLLCMAGLAGLPQVVMPWRRFDGAPLGLSLMGAHGTDHQVLEAARFLYRQCIQPLEPAP